MRDTSWRVMLGTLLFCLFASVVLLVLLAWPFDPYRVYGTEIIPSEVCPGQDVMVQGDSEVNAEGRWRVARIETDSVWEPTDESGLVPQSGGTGVIYEPADRKRSTIISTVIRTAPTEPGRYTLATTATTYGTFKMRPLRGFPKVQHISYESIDATTVLPQSDEACRDSAEGRA